MPVLANERQEKACQLRAKGLTQAEAYELAGYTPSRSNASALFSQPEIKQRLAEIKEEREKLEARRRAAHEELQKTQGELGIEDLETENHGITREWIILQYKEVIKNAQQEGKHAAAASALREVTKLLGLDKPPPGDPNKAGAPQGPAQPKRSTSGLMDALTEEADEEVAQEEAAEDGDHPTTA